PLDDDRRVDHDVAGHRLAVLLPHLTNGLDGQVLDGSAPWNAVRVGPDRTQLARTDVAAHRLDVEPQVVSYLGERHQPFGVHGDTTIRDSRRRNERGGAWRTTVRRT